MAFYLVTKQQIFVDPHGSPDKGCSFEELDEDLTQPFIVIYGE